MVDGRGRRSRADRRGGRCASAASEVAGRRRPTGPSRPRTPPARSGRAARAARRATRAARAGGANTPTVAGIRRDETCCDHGSRWLRAALVCDAQASACDACRGRWSSLSLPTTSPPGTRGRLATCRGARPGPVPWPVLVSEVMLQQTPVARVVPAWTAWLERWPTPADLAAASPGDAVRMWGKLGYPRRALRLHECARAIVARFDGAVPADVGDAGVAARHRHATPPGRSPSSRYGQRHPVVDTNVRRVVARAVLGPGRTPGRPSPTPRPRRGRPRCCRPTRSERRGPASR